MPPQGEGGGGIFSALASVIGGLFGLGGESGQFSQIQQQGNAAAQAFLQEQITSLFSQLKSLAQVVFKALRHILDDIIHLRFLHLLQDYEALKEKLKAWARRHPLLLRFLRGILHPTQTALIGNVLNLIQRIRQLLVIFRVFHLRFATVLDRFLVRLEGRIIRNTTAIVRKVNEVNSLLSLILDPFRFIRDNPIFATLTRGLDAWLKLLTGHGFRDLVGHPTDRTGARSRVEHWAEVRSDLLRTAAGEPTLYSPIGEQVSFGFQALSSELAPDELRRVE
jgi:hypothetical protein